MTINNCIRFKDFYFQVPLTFKSTLTLVVQFQKAGKNQLLN
jgi:hypothetical protein